MPNIANVLRDEIARISRRETRKETAVLKRASANYRREIAALKRKIAVLTKSNARSTRSSVEVSTEEPTSSHRFVARGFRTLRHRLGLSAAQMGTLLGVSEQSIYNWETKVAVPRRSHLPAIAQLRGKGKREIAAMLHEQRPASAKDKASKRKAPKGKGKTMKKRS